MLKQIEMYRMLPHLVQALDDGVPNGLGLVYAIDGIAPPLHPHRHHQLLPHLHPGDEA